MRQSKLANFGWMIAAFFGLCYGATSPSRAQKNTEIDHVYITVTEDLTIKSLLDFVSQRLSVNIIYDPEAMALPANIKAPQDIPINSLMPLLENVLRAKGYTIVDASVAGSKRVIKSNPMTKFAPLKQFTRLVSECRYVYVYI